MLSVNDLTMVHELNIPTCSTSQKATDAPLFAHLIMPVSATDFRDFLDEVDELVQLAPEILVAIENDLDTHVFAKRRLRMADRKFLDGRTDELPELDICECNRLAKELSLAVGRPRMAGFSVFVFLMLRGFLGSLTTKTAGRFLSESMSLHAFLQFRGLKLPAWTTILENVNLVSLATRELIFERQIKNLVLENLDDFQQLTIDSTAVKANSSWPTDGKILTGLLGRAHRLGQKFHLFGLANFRKGWVPRWLSEMEKLEFKICLAAGKAKSRGKLKKVLPTAARAGRESRRLVGGRTRSFRKGAGGRNACPQSSGTSEADPGADLQRCGRRPTGYCVCPGPGVPRLAPSLHREGAESLRRIGGLHQEGRAQSTHRLQATTGSQRQRFCHQPDRSRRERGGCNTA